MKEKRQIDKRFFLTAAVLCAVCFAIHICGIQRLYSPFLYPEEMGYWADAAAMTGRDWGYVIQHSNAPWYTYGYSLTLAPLFLIFDNMVSMYRAAIVLNSIWATLDLLICYLIAKRLGKGLNRYCLLLISFVVALYPAYIHQAKIAVVETFLYFVIWLMFLAFIRYEERPTPGRGIWLGCAVAFVYIVHNRTIGILAAFILTALFMLARRKIDWKGLLCLLVPVVIIMAVNRQIVGYLSGMLWGTANRSDADYIGGMAAIARLFTDMPYLIGFIKSIIGKLWYAFTASYMVCFWGLIYGAQRLYRYFKKPDSEQLPYSLVFFLLSYLAVIGICALAMNNMAGPAATRRIDIIIYGRYAECAVGIFLLLGALKLFEIASEPRMHTAVLFGCGAAMYIVFSLIVVRYGDYLTAINHGEMALPTTQVNSTPGILFFHLLGEFSLRNCSIFAAAVSAIIFLSFRIGNNGVEYRAFAGALSVGCFLITGAYSTSTYTFANQGPNGSESFRELVDAVESKLTGKRIFVASEDIYVYFDFQNNMINNTIYCGGGIHL